MWATVFIHLRLLVWFLNMQLSNAEGNIPVFSVVLFISIYRSFLAVQFKSVAIPLLEELIPESKQRFLNQYVSQVRFIFLF